MAQATFQEMAREIVLYSDGVCPITLARRWVRDRYRKICERQVWSFKLGRSAFATSAIYSTGTISLANNSATVTGTDTVFTADMVGRQLKVNGYVFTITVWTSTTSIDVDQVWLGASASTLTYSIVQAYITPSPTDFHAFYSVVDPTNSWRLHLSYNVQELDRIDARRASTGTPYIIANGIYNSSNIPMFELWPHSNTQRMYTYTYEKRVADPADADSPPAIIRSDIIIKGALADLVRWPGTPERKNAMYDPTLIQWKARETEFKEELEKAIVEDQSILMTDLKFGTNLRYFPIDANFMRTHAFPAY